MNEQIRKQEICHTLKAYAATIFRTRYPAQMMLGQFDTDTITDPVERHLVTYLRWYADGNQDGGACARVALEIAS